ncbi:MAG: VCBS repeat-containing protein [Saprospiraceae bacterium]|nr:VCBS repeat-containing protein [Saprospiraceae bacterium]
MKKYLTIKKFNFLLHPLSTGMLASIFFFTACQQKNETTQNSESRFELMDEKTTGISFENQIHNTEEFNIFNYRNFYNGGGVGIGDINNDGLADVYFTANMGSNKLYLNKGNLTFEDITAQSGTACEENWSTGVVMVDINGDHFLDIYVCNAGLNEDKTAGQKNKLYINNQDNTFTEKAAEYQLDDDGYTTHAAFFDYDKDGDLDVYLLNNSFIPVNTLNYSNKRDLKAEDWPVKDFLKGGGDKLLRNDNNVFTDVSDEAGIFGSLIGFGLGVNISDVNGDGYDDIYVSNDFFEKDYLYINQKDGTFKEELESRIKHISMSSMGADIADLNNDGHVEIFTTDMLPISDKRLKTTSSYDNVDVQGLRRKQGFYDQYMQNNLQFNTGDGQFCEIAQFSKVAASDWSWGALMFDADNDGLNDIYVCNGIYSDVIDQDFIDFFADEISQKMALSGEKSKIDEIIKHMPSNPIENNFFHNKGGMKFEEQAQSFGLKEKSFSNGAAYGDLDNDGDLDLVVNNVNQKAFVYQNHTPADHHFIKVSLKGTEKNTFGIGTKVTAYTANGQISREMIPSRGFQSSIDYTQVLGIGHQDRIDSLLVIWPDGAIQKITNVGIDTLLTFDIKNAGDQILLAGSPEQARWFEAMTSNFTPHIENDFVDFYYEPNIPFKTSREGPAMAVADINGDGAQDVYLGGAKGQAGQLYVYNTSSRQFELKEEKAFERFTYFEDVSAAFFDADMDGDQDLLVASGGNEYQTNDLEILPRLFLNDGKGNFQVSKFPRTTSNLSVVLPFDADQDGDIDVFLGGKSVTREFGLDPESYLMLNDKGTFTLAGNDALGKLKNVGNVNDAAIADIDGDGQQELVVVGEWFAPSIFRFENGKFKAIEARALTNKNGWYRSIEPSDIDGDGDIDLLLGNLGANFNLKPDDKHPVKLFISDFDGNGSIDKVLTKTADGKDKPVYLKREVTSQLNFLKKKNLNHAVFAEKSIQELLPQDLVNKAMVKIFTEPLSYIALNDGKGNFEIHYLDAMAQWSCINDFLVDDFDGDGRKEILAVGNFYHFSSNFTKLDASNGLLISFENGKAVSKPSSHLGYSYSGEARKIALVNNGDKMILTALNNDKPLLHKINSHE